MISPFSARQLAGPNVRKPFSDDPRNVKSGMKSRVAAKTAERRATVAATVEMKVFVDTNLLLRQCNKLRLRAHRCLRIAIANEIITANGGPRTRNWSSL